MIPCYTGLSRQMQIFTFTLAFLCVSLKGIGQSADDAEFGTQLRKIIASASTNFSSLRKGPATETPLGRTFGGKILIGQTQSSEVVVAVSRNENDRYRILVGTNLDKGTSLAMNELWDKKLRGALGPVNRDCRVIDLPDSESADRCDFEVARTGFTAVVSLLRTPIAGSGRYMLELVIEKKS